MQAKKEVKQSRDAKLLQNRVAMNAEEEVQKRIQKAIPVHVFRGVNTFDDVGRLLQSLGIKQGGGDKNTFECEHDIVVVALLPSGPLVSFVQVKSSEADTPCDPKPEVDQKVDGSSKTELTSWRGTHCASLSWSLTFRWPTSGLSQMWLFPWLQNRQTGP